ncbi:putative structural protein [uncultured virus]|uniref:Putative structural protein n=1 Tax=uncultured virus TaxID=340016 RepID=A0A218MML3_9VIRU|nr:putative structural protein [uncultured virus]
MAESGIKSYFPSQTVSDAEKISYDYGLKVGKAIEQEWFNNDRSVSRYKSNHNNFHNLRLYARGEQSIQKYKDELSINGDLSYLNLDWKPVPIISKFVDIVVNGIAERTYDIKAYSQDPFGVAKRTEYMESILKDMRLKEFNAAVQNELQLNVRDSQIEELPETQEELDLHMQLSYKQSVELAEEQALNVLFEGNNYELIKKQFYYDLAVLGIGAVKTSFNTSEGVVIDYVDPANLVYSYTDSPYFEDIYYVGEAKTIPVNELAKQFPHLSESDLEDIMKNKPNNTSNYNSRHSYEKEDNNTIQVLYFNYKTYMNEVYKVKETGTGAEKIISKDDSFNPPENMEGGFGRMIRSIECLYEGAMILGTDKLLKWEMAKNMMRPKSDFTKVKMNYSIVAPRMYDGKIDSLVKRITGFADMIQLTHLKLQQVMSRLVPDGVYMDADGLAEIDLGNGTNYNPQEALNMFFQTGSVIGRSFTSDGDMNPGKVPIQEIQSGSGGNKMQALIGNYNYYLQMIRDVTGLNEARDGSMPDKNALVGVQKLAAANSNTATRHILQAGLFLTAETAECLSLRISDIIEYSPTKDAFIQQIGVHNVATLKEMSQLHLYDFGIFLQLQPDEEERMMLENNIQMAIQQQIIELADAIDIREIKNIKLANQLLKIRRKRKLERDQAMQQQNIQIQAQANQQSAQAAAQAEVQKNQALTQSQAQLEQIKSQLNSQKMMQEVEHKKELMRLEFEMNMQLKNMEIQGVKSKDKEKEDRKDERTKIQATQQSELIDQRKNEKPPKNFESAGNDILGGGFGLGTFDPR